MQVLVDCEFEPDLWSEFVENSALVLYLRSDTTLAVVCIAVVCSIDVMLYYMQTNITCCKI